MDLITMNSKTKYVDIQLHMNASVATVLSPKSKLEPDYPTYYPPETIRELMRRAGCVIRSVAHTM